ncbi:MAG: DUF3805 domain-containing protein [Bacteroides sp.]|nr:DUF3805 domain-containing protein [Bacteroides sp.]
MQAYKKFISPGAWFSMCYPSSWVEAEDGESTFLFYDPNVWSGNFRISSYRDPKNPDNISFVENFLRQELKENPQARSMEVNGLSCAYSRDEFHENGHNFVTHVWIMGMGSLVFDCSFTVEEGMDVKVAEEIIASLQIRETGKKYPPELIPVRLSEIYQINEGYEWVAQAVKKEFRKEFQAIEEDLPKLQQIIDKGDIAPKNKEAWISLGIAICAILANEVEGFEWNTLIDGNREAPVLKYRDSELVVDPMKLVWSRVRNGLPCLVNEEYQEILESIPQQ